MLKIAHTPIFQYPVPDNHRFPMAKYSLIPQRLLAEGTISQSGMFHPRMLSEDEILSTHTVEYWQSLKEQTIDRKLARAIGFEMSEALIERERYVVGATYECALYALSALSSNPQSEQAVALSTSGGTHHAFSDRGEGFCIFNDVCVACNLLLQKGLVKKVLSVDLDVHQGNGNASIMANEDRVFVFSMHGEKNYPFRKPPSDLDIELANDTNDNTYLQILADTLPRLIAETQPDLIFYQAGVDVLATDKLGKLALTREGCKQRDKLVLQLAKANAIPVVVVMGGGYSADINDVVEAHCNTFRVARDLYG